MMILRTLQSTIVALALVIGICPTTSVSGATNVDPRHTYMELGAQTVADTTPDDTNGALFDLLSQLGQKASYEQVYTFHHKITSRYTVSSEGQDSEPVVMSSLLGDGMLATLMEDEERTTIIMDDKNGSMLTIDEDAKEGQVMSMGFMKALMEEVITDMSDEDVKVEHTGQVKEINGYRCKEVVMTSDQAKCTLWITDEAGIKHKDLMSSMSSMSQSMGGPMAAMQGAIKDIDGFIILMDLYEDGELTMKTEVLSISHDQVIYDLGDYKISQAVDE